MPVRAIHARHNLAIHQKKENIVDKEKEISALLLKVAKGCKVAEVTEEYAEVDGQLKLLKCKKTKKEIPPDLKALQLLIGNGEISDVSKMTDEELETEKKRLLAALQEKSEKKTPTKKAAKKKRSKKE